MNMHNIVYYGNVLYPDKDAASHRTIGNAKALRELGYKVTLIGTKKGECRPVLETKESYAGFDIFYFPDPQNAAQWRDYLFGLKPLEDVIASQSKVDAVILYNHPSVSTNNILQFCHKHGIKVYADCTEWFDPKSLSVHSLIKKIDTWYRMRIINKKLDGIITISSFLQEYYSKNGCRTICVPPLIDLSDAKWDCTGYIMNGSMDDYISLCYVGNPGAGTKDKLNYILMSLNQLLEMNSDIKLQMNIAGMTVQQYREIFKDDPNRYTFAKFHGMKSNAEALSIIKKSDFSIFLRENNLICKAGFPTKFSESIACGTPVLTNITSDLGKYLNEGKNGFILDLSSERSLASSLEKALLTPRNKINSMKRYCRDEKTFDYHLFIKELSTFFSIL